jgi:hypothetical protein
MTGTGLLVGQILTALLFAAVGVGLVVWLFRPGATGGPVVRQGERSPVATPRADDPAAPADAVPPAERRRVRLTPPPPGDVPPP